MSGVLESAAVRQLPTPNFQLPIHSQAIDRNFFGSWELEVGS